MLNSNESSRPSSIESIRNEEWISIFTGKSVLDLTIFSSFFRPKWEDYLRWRSTEKQHQSKCFSFPGFLAFFSVINETKKFLSCWFELTMIETQRSRHFCNLIELINLHFFVFKQKLQRAELFIEEVFLRKVLKIERPRSTGNKLLEEYFSRVFL